MVLKLPQAFADFGPRGRASCRIEVSDNGPIGPKVCCTISNASAADDSRSGALTTLACTSINPLSASKPSRTSGPPGAKNPWLPRSWWFLPGMAKQDLHKL
jgi:hypothetical protein